MGFFDPFSGAADVGKLKSDLSSLKSDVETHTNNNDIHVTASDKNNWNSKLDKNQGSENSGKVLGTNANGEVIPLNGYGFEYDEETKMLKYGTDPTINLNQGIGLDDTLSKRGYAADAGAVGELKGDLAQFGLKHINLFNTNTITPERYITGDKLVFNTSFFTTDYIDVSNINSLTTSYTLWGAFYDENKTYIGDAKCTSETEDITFNIIENAKYFRVCARNEYMDKVQVGVNVSRNKYYPYDIYTLDNLHIAKIINTTHIYVGVGKEFTNISSALDSITDNSEKSRYIIHVEKGDYNESFTTKDYVDIIGENPYQTIINYISDDESDYVNRSAIFATSYTKLENLTIETKGSKYPVHCDGAYNIPYEVVIKNCILRHNGFDTLPTQAGTAIGIGLYHGQHVKLIECELYGKNGVYGSADIYCHNSADTDERHSKYRSLRVENCVLGECTYGMRLQALENNQMQDNDCVLIGNVNNGLTKFFKQSTSKDSWHIRQFGQTWAN